MSTTRYIVMAHRSAASQFGEGHRPVKDAYGNVESYKDRGTAQAIADSYNRKPPANCHYTVEAAS